MKLRILSGYLWFYNRIHNCEFLDINLRKSGWPLWTTIDLLHLTSHYEKNMFNLGEWDGQW
jgi:hypothetical protein